MTGPPGTEVGKLAEAGATNGDDGRADPVGVPVAARMANGASGGTGSPAWRLSATVDGSVAAELGAQSFLSRHAEAGRRLVEAQGTRGA